MKKIISLLSLLVFTISLSSCSESQSSDQIMNQKQEHLQKESVAQIGMPAIKNFQEKKLAKLIMELRDQENLHTYTYLVSQMTGKLVYVGESIGYGLPYATQYTSPEKLSPADCGQYCDEVSMPQADPNGLFMPSSAQGTWIMLIDPITKEPRPTYFEPEIVVSPFKISN